MVNASITEIVTASPAAVQRAKALIARVANHVSPAAAAQAQAPVQPHADVKDFVCNEIASIRVSAEGQEGLKSFFEKRKPAWRS